MSGNIGSPIIPERYYRLVTGFGDDQKIVQVGCSAIEWEDLFKELETLDETWWIKQNIVDYKISIMKMDGHLCKVSSCH